MNPIVNVLHQFGIDDAALPHGNGHINNTFLVECNPRVILQRINTSIFKKPAEVMENIMAVTAYLREKIAEKGGDPEAIVKERGLGAVSDLSALEAFVDQAIAANPGPVADFKAGKKAAAGFFVGQVMKLSKGKADPKIVGGIVAKKLAEA